MNTIHLWLVRAVLKNTTLILFILLFVAFGALSPSFLTLRNFEIILSNASYIGIIAVGMTCVLLTGGIDLSVGAVMYASAVVVGLLIDNADVPIPLALMAGLLVGLAFGLFNALVIAVLGVPPFIATLVTMIGGRGAGLLLTQSAAVDFPDELTLLSSLRIFGIQLNILIFGLVVAAASIFLRFTASGRRLYAVGNDPEAARKAGINAPRIIGMTYVISGACAALAGFVSISQLGRVNAGFGAGNEFDAIAASVLGGASLFGGVGTAFPGTVLGTIMIQMIQAGLVFVRVDLYIQPIVMGGIIFFAVFLDSFRQVQLRKFERRNIMRMSET